MARIKRAQIRKTRTKKLFKRSKRLFRSTRNHPSSNQRSEVMQAKGQRLPWPERRSANTAHSGLLASTPHSCHMR